MRVVVQRRTGRSVAERHASSPDGELHGLEKRKMVEEGASGKGGESENCVDKDRGAESKAGVVELTVPDPSSFSLSVTKLMSEDETDTVACRCANAKRKTLQHSPPLLWHRSANATTAPRFLTHVLRSENAARWRGRPSRSLELQDKAKTTGGSTLQTPEFFFFCSFLTTQLFSHFGNGSSGSHGRAEQTQRYVAQRSPRQRVPCPLCVHRALIIGD